MGSGAPVTFSPCRFTLGKTKEFLETFSDHRMAYALLGEIPDMKPANPFQFRSRLAFGGAILAQQATFLPVASAWRGHTGDVCTPERQHLAGFMPTFNFNRKNLTVARPLLKDQLQ
jgi:hypothetical protein